MIKTRENAATKRLNIAKAFTEFSNTMEDIYEDIGGYNPTRKRKLLLVFDDMIAGIMSNKKFQTVVK